MKREASSAASPTNADLELVGADGSRILVDVKVREGDPKRRDLDVANELLKRTRGEGWTSEVWFFNIERLKLMVMRYDQSSRLAFDYFVPINVWEKTPEGVYERQRVVEEVEDWFSRIDAFYRQILAWLDDQTDLRFEQTRTVIMSEELMQKYAVVDRELRVLDVIREEQVIASFVPRGLWLIGSWGRIDMITRDRTIVIVAIKENDRYEWKFAPPDIRHRLKPFDKSALVELTSGQ